MIDSFIRRRAEQSLDLAEFRAVSNKLRRVFEGRLPEKLDLIDDPEEECITQ
jgi:hypothetical protein